MCFFVRPAIETYGEIGTGIGVRRTVFLGEGLYNMGRYMIFSGKT